MNDHVPVVVILLAVSLNYALVGVLHMEKLLAYALVMVFQVALGFALNVVVIFDPSRRSVSRRFTSCLAEVRRLRLTDGILYSPLFDASFTTTEGSGFAQRRVTSDFSAATTRSGASSGISGYIGRLMFPRAHASAVGHPPSRRSCRYAVSS